MINRITLLLFIGLAFWSCEEDNDEPQSDTLVIEVNEETGGSGVMVWFSPSSGEITAAESEERPDEKYVYWIEPNNPEFQNGDYWHCNDPEEANEECVDCYENGIKFSGQGDNYFEETTISSDGCLKPNLLDVDGDTLAINNVYFFKEGNDYCLIQILEWVQYEPSPSLTFKWKKLE
jgi:hypothetical protein